MRFFLLLLLATTPFVAQAAAPIGPALVPDPSAPESPSEIIELPKFVVTDTRELPAPESWRYAQIPGLEVLSTVSENTTRRLVRDFQRLQQVIELVWPAITRGPPPLQGMLILCAPDKSFDSFMPAGPIGVAARPTSLFLQEVDRSAIVLDYVKDRYDDRLLPTSSLAAAGNFGLDAAGDEPPTGAPFMIENDPFREFYLQYFRSVIRRSGEAPAWLEEGLVQVLASVQFSKEEIALGRLQDGAGGQRPDEFNVRLNRQPLLDFNKVFAAVPPDGIEALTYSPQCYAFVHLCLYGKKGTLQAPLQKLVRRAATEPVTEKVFKECFGLSYDQIGALVRAHISGGAHHYIQLRAAKGTSLLAEPAAFTLREATQAEIGRMKGETYRMAGHNDRARLALIAPYIRGEQDLPLVGALGLHARATGDTERARKFLEAAAQAKIPRARVYVELARLRLADAKAAAGGKAALDESTTARVLQPLLFGVRLAPPMPEIYELMAEVRAQSTATPTAADMALIYEGAHRYPQRLRLIYLAAALALRQGENSAARSLIEHGLTLAGKTETAQHFKALQSQLP